MITYAPAKINLSLDVFGVRPDGYHEILTVYQTVSLYDVIEWDIVEGKRFEVRCMMYEIDGRYNSVWRAAKEFFKFAGISDKGFVAEVNKNIPIQAGLGGGSSDAAAIVMALADHFKIYPPIEFFESLGADVPYFTMRGTALGRGKGTELSSLEPLEDIYTVIVQGSSRISTEKAYEIIDTIENEAVPTQKLIDAIYEKDFTKICRNCGNVFEQAAADMEIFEIDAIKASLEIMGARRAMMTGSGSAVFGLFDNEQQAKDVAAMLRKDFQFAQPAKFIKW